MDLNFLFIVDSSINFEFKYLISVPAAPIHPVFDFARTIFKPGKKVARTKNSTNI